MRTLDNVFWKHAIRVHVGWLGAILLSGVLSLVSPGVSVADQGVMSDQVSTVGSSSLAKSYVCWPLQDALEDLRASGLKIIYSSDLVTPDLQVKREPTATTPRGLLDQLLRPHGLKSRSGAGETYLIVRTGATASGTRRLSKTSSADRAGGGHSSPLPDFIHQGDVGWGEVPFPFVTGDLAEITSQSRYAVIQLARQSDKAWNATDAFVLKELIVALRAQSEDLRIALEGQPAQLEQVVSKALAPYIDAYVYRHERFVPSHDSSARSWWRASAEGPELMAKLLEAGRRGDELLIAEGPSIDDVHDAFLRRIQSTLSGDLETQPKLFGIDQERVRFFLNPESGAYYLAVYADVDLGRSVELSFFLHQAVVAESLFPSGAAFDLAEVASGMQLTLPGDYPYYLFELTPRRRKGVAQDLTIRSSHIIDPYEEVVKNQVFQERERTKFQSLDVMEYIKSTPQSASAARTGWEHRIIRRRDHWTEYHHLAFFLNGVREPDRKLLKGRIFRSEALVALNPLEVELDSTYRYEYLGEETVDGFPTWKIRFEPLKQGSVGDGTFVSGVVWLDQKSRAHRKMRTYQKGLDSSLISHESDYFYSWINSNDECFWDWRRREGVVVFSSLGQQFSTTSETVRQNFKFNRPDIEEVVRASHESDILIHVETPPVGHRWLVKDDGRRRLGKLEYDPSRARNGASFDIADSSEGAAEADEKIADSAAGGRVLADVHSFSNRMSFSLGGFSAGEGFDLYPGLVFTDSDLFGKGYQAYAGFFLEDLFLSLGKPNLFGSDSRNTGVFLTGSLRVPYSTDANRATEEIDGVERNLDLRTREEALALTLGIPLTRRSTLSAGYELRNLNFTEASEAEPDFVLPQDTLEHVVSAELSMRWKRFASTLGVEHGRRDDWQPWGLQPRGLGSQLDLTEPFETDTYTVAAWTGGFFQPIRDYQSMAVTLSYLKGFDLDRFSRLRSGRARAGVAGFSSTLAADEAIRLNVGYSLRALRRFPLQLRLSSSRQWLDAERAQGPRDFVGVGVSFLVHGPWRLDIWPSISHGVYSNVEGEAGDTVLGVSLGWRE